jgi:protocatechuate 3,4-dioxygenase beta subunit
MAGMLSRRDVLWLLAAGTTGAARAFAGDARPATPNLTAGPFYPVRKPVDRDADLTVVRGRRGKAKGQVIHVTGRVLDRGGAPHAGVRIEIWQANAAGRYTHPSDRNPAPLDPSFEGYAVQVTDREGRYHFKTIRPGGYPGEFGTRTPHIHFDVTGKADRKVTQMFFPGEPLNEQDGLFRNVRGDASLLVATALPADPEHEPESLYFQWDIVLPRG